MDGNSAVDRQILDVLIDEGVVVESDGGERLSLTESYIARRNRRRSELRDLDDATFVAKARPYTEETPLTPENTSRELIADTMVLAHEVGTLRPRNLLGVALLLGSIEESNVTDGIPEAFTPIRGRDIVSFINLTPAAVIYCWGDDCDPCDVVRRDFEELIDEGAIPGHVALGAVYAPDSQEVLYTEYDVGIVPTLLFCANGRVDSRLLGAHEPSVVEAEIDTIKELSEQQNRFS